MLWARTILNLALFVLFVSDTAVCTMRARSPSAGQAEPADPNNDAAAGLNTFGRPDLNVEDACPNDPNKLAPGLCGCGFPDVDADGDSLCDTNGDTLGVVGNADTCSGTVLNCLQVGYSACPSSMTFAGSNAARPVTASEVFFGSSVPTFVSQPDALQQGAGSLFGGPLGAVCSFDDCWSVGSSVNHEGQFFQLCASCTGDSAGNSTWVLSLQSPTLNTLANITGHDQDCVDVSSWPSKYNIPDASFQTASIQCFYCSPARDTGTIFTTITCVTILWFIALPMLFACCCCALFDVDIPAVAFTKKAALLEASSAYVKTKTTISTVVTTKSDGSTSTDTTTASWSTLFLEWGSGHQTTFMWLDEGPPRSALMLGKLTPYAAVQKPLRGSMFIWKLALGAAFVFNVIAVIAFVHWEHRGYDHLAEFMLGASILCGLPILLSPIARVWLIKRVEARLDQDFLLNASQ